MFGRQCITLLQSTLHQTIKWHKANWKHVVGINEMFASISKSIQGQSIIGCKKFRIVIVQMVFS